MKIVASNLGAWKKATRETTDLSKPAGVFNVIVEAIQHKPQRRMKVFELLDETSHKHLEAGGLTIKRLQRALEKRFLRNANRQSFLKKHGLLWIERVRGAKALFAGLWDNGFFKDELPLVNEVTIRAVQTLEGGRAVLTAATGKGERSFPFIQVEAGQWRFLGLGKVIRREAITKPEAALEKLAEGP